MCEEKEKEQEQEQEQNDDMNIKQMPLTTLAKKNLVHKILKLSDEEHIQIFQMLDKHNIPYTLNCNGIFVSLSSIPVECINEIKTYVDKCIKTVLDREYEERHRLSQSKQKQLNNTNPLRHEPEKGQTHVPCMNSSVKSKVNLQKDWDTLVGKGNDANKNVMTFMQHFNVSLENIHKNKANTKYNNAKKRLARQIVSDKKFDPDLANVLTQEEYQESD